MTTFAATKFGITPSTAPDNGFDDLARARFAWPEALLIDLVSETYGDTPAASERMTAARLHVRFLHELTDGSASAAASLRLDLIGCCAARGISLDAIEAADTSAFREMLSMVKTRFRNSPRLQLQTLGRLHRALGRLPRREAAKPASSFAQRLRGRGVAIGGNRSPLELSFSG